jgi:CheY-like chemotaxis protein
VAAESKGLRFALHLAADLPAQFSTDPTRLRQILNNLLNNAVKFTERGEISLAVSLGRRRGLHRARHRHRHPAGQPRHDFREIQATRKLPDPRTWRHRAWAGTGQATGRPYGRPHHARLGSRRRLDLHRFPACLDPDAHDPRLALVVDDQPTNRLLASTLLKRWGWTVLEAESGEAALASPANTPSGSSCSTSACPACPARKPAPAAANGQSATIIAYTAHAFPKTDRLLGGGFDDVLVKPINRQQLETMVAEL